ncbi:MAG: RidA family protein [Dehalococcoidia bacterium]|nr:RidA family protein [Dehalococcoidia bacterium]
MAAKRTVDPEGAATAGYSRGACSHAVDSSDTLWVSGITAAEPDPSGAGWACKGDMGRQTAAAYEKLLRIMGAAGYGLSDLVKVIYYMTPEALPSFNQSIGVRAELMGVEGLPAVTAIAVEALLDDGALVEMEAVAERGGKERPHYPDPRNDWRLPYKPAWGGGRVLWFAGVVARSYDEMGTPSFPDGIVAQTRAIYVRARRILESAGMGFEDVVKTVDYIVPEALEGYGGTEEVRREVFGEHLPASTNIVIDQLLAPGALAEIDMFAVAGGTRKVIGAGRQGRGGATFHPAVQKGGLLFLSGQTGVDGTGALVGGGVAAQARQAFANVGELVGEAGGGPGNVVRTIEYLAPQAASEHQEVQKARRELYGDDLPATTTVVVTRLLQPGALVQVQAFADLA